MANMRVAKFIAPGLLLVLAFVLMSTAQRKTERPDLSAVTRSKKWKIHNRQFTVLEENGRMVLHLDSRPLDGLLWFEGIEFGDGEIEFDVRGKDAFQRSFVGAAFHLIDENTFDAVYFRPFNFRSTDEQRRVHAVQYESLPGNDWKHLREAFPGKYENSISPVPDPNGWFHVRIVVEFPRIAVFVNGATEPCLEVEQLSGQKRGRVGFLVGDNSDGDFADLRITPKRRKS